ncbi:MAG: alpha/beta hydrolase [Myxococcota bacterium]|nr:alpha/beta hydrolase [Myxococcota bacterium]
MARAEIVGPSSSFYVSQRLRLHYVDWGREGAPPLVLVHGGRDHARSWDRVALALRDAWRVVAPDLRGHGDSAWAVGGTYSIAEFVLDLARLVDALDLPQVRLVGHSLGGAVVLQYAGLFPERVARVVAIEGLGPSPELQARIEATPAWKRLLDWIGSMDGLAARTPRRYASIDEAAARMREVNPHLDDAMARHLTVHGVARNEDGTFSWKFDNHVRAFAPVRLSGEEVRAIRARVACPVLLLRGEESWASDPERDGRMADFRDARLVNVPGAGHWVHHDRPEAFLRAVRGFLEEEAAAPAARQG